jgi:hypothetical protein
MYDFCGVVMLIAHYFCVKLTHYVITLLRHSTNQKTLLHVFTGVSVGQQQHSAIIGGVYFV